MRVDTLGDRWERVPWLGVAETWRALVVSDSNRPARAHCGVALQAGRIPESAVRNSGGCDPVRFARRAPADGPPNAAEVPRCVRACEARCGPLCYEGAEFCAKRSPTRGPDRLTSSVRQPLSTCPAHRPRPDLARGCVGPRQPGSHTRVPGGGYEGRWSLRAPAFSELPEESPYGSNRHCWLLRVCEHECPATMTGGPR